MYQLVAPRRIAPGRGCARRFSCACTAMNYVRYHTVCNVQGILYHV